MNRLLVTAALAVLMLACGSPSGPDGGGGGSGGGSGGGAGGGPTLTTISLGTWTRPDGGTDTARGSHARYSPDSKQLAYLRRESDDLVAVMSASGTGSKTLTGGSYLTGFAWKADGTEILYSGTSVSWISADGGTPRNIFGGGLSGFASMAPDLSPDGTRLVYGVNGTHMKLVDLSAATLAETDLGVAGSSPRFSPNGAKIVFNAYGKVTLMDVATKATTELFDARDSFGSVDWFKDGLRIVAGTDQGIEIVTVGPPISRRTIYSTSATLSLDLSPDEKSICWSINGQPEIFVLTGF